jgi:protein TonB
MNAHYRPSRRPVQFGVAWRDLAKSLTSLCQNVAMAETHPLLKSLLSPRSLKLLAIAFGIGLLLFLFLWLDQRNTTDFFKASGPGTNSGDAEVLPAPIPADVASERQNVSGIVLPPVGGQPTNSATSTLPRIVEPTAPPAPAAQPMPSDNAATSGPTSTSASTTSPVAISQPTPIYPRDSLRRGIGGTVRVQATVSPDGSVERMEVAASSGDRNLDRAAMEAVRRWRFKPALRNGQPVSATVLIPLDFTPNP